MATTQTRRETKQTKSNPLSLQERLDALTDKSAGPDGCWIWQGELVKGPDGVERHGRLHIRRDASGELADQNEYAHRAAFELAHGPIPDGMIVRHLCHRCECVNPAHLAIGDQIDNKADDIIADRGRISFRAGHALIALSDFVREHGRPNARPEGRRKGPKADPVAKMARIFDVSESAVRALPKRPAWRRAIERYENGERPMAGGGR